MRRGAAFGLGLSSPRRLPVRRPPHRFQGIEITRKSSSALVLPEYREAQATDRLSLVIRDRDPADLRDEFSLSSPIEPLHEGN